MEKEKEIIVNKVKELYPFIKIKHILYVPFHKGYVRRTRADAWKKRKVVEEYYTYKDNIRNLLKEIGYNDLLKANVAFCISVKKSYSKSKINSLLYQLHNEKPDIDNLVKAFMDINKEDKKISFLLSFKIWSLYNYILILDFSDHNK